MVGSPYWSNASAGIDKMMQQGYDVHMNAQMRATQQFEKSIKTQKTQQDKFMRDSVREFKKALQETNALTDKEMRMGAKKSTAAIKDFLKGASDESAKGSKKFYQHFAVMFKEIRDSAKKHQLDIKNVMAESNKGSGGKNVFADLRDKTGGKLKGEIGEVVSELKSMVPALAAIGGAAAFVTTLFRKMTQLDDITHDLLVSTGGYHERVALLKSSLADLSNETKLSQEQLGRLANAYLDNGMSMNKLGEEMNQYLAISGKAVKIFQVSEQEASKYFKTLGEADTPFSSMAEDMDNTVRQMTSLGLTVRDVARSFTEANYAYDQYGGTLGKNVGEFKKGFMGMRSLFKSMNMDADQAAGSYNNLMGDINKRMAQSAFIGSSLGMSSDAAFRALSDPRKGTELRMRGGLQTVASLMGGQANTLGMDESKLTDAQYRSSQQRLSYAMSTAESMGYDPQMLKGTLGQFRNKMIAKGGTGQNIMGEIARFLPDMIKAQEENNPMRTLEETTKGIESTLSASVEEIGRRIDNSIAKIAAFAQDKLVPFFGVVTDFMTKAWPRFEAWVQDIYMWLDKKFGLTTGTGFAGSDAGKMATAVAGPNSLIGNFNKAVGIPSIDLTGNQMRQREAIARSGAKGVGKSDWDYLGAAFDQTMGGGSNVVDMKGYRNTKFHSDASKNAQIVAKVAREMGMDPATAVASMLQESRGNAEAAGDYGNFAGGKFHPMRKGAPGASATSHGLFQLHKGGKLGSLTPEQAHNPELNARYALKEMARLQKLHPSWSPGEVAAASQRPADQAGYAKSVNGLMGDARGLLGGGPQVVSLPLLGKNKGGKPKPGEVAGMMPPPPVAIQDSAANQAIANSPEVLDLMRRQAAALEKMNLNNDLEAKKRDQHMKEIKRGIATNNPGASKQAGMQARSAI